MKSMIVEYKLTERVIVPDIITEEKIMEIAQKKY